jgi:NAD(P)H-quinone oxidoreductase subunit 5
MALGLFALISVVIGSLAITAQGSVKASLAWSTVAQMGFMLLQCAIGAFAAALFHIIVHALYKAHAFLSAGEAGSVCAPRQQPTAIAWLSLMLILTCGLLVTALAPSAELALSGCALLAAISLTSARSPLIALAIGIFLSVLIGLNHLIWKIDVLTLNVHVQDEAWDRLFAFSLVLLALGQRALAAPSFARLQKTLKVHARNGFYINAFLNRSLNL